MGEKQLCQKTSRAVFAGKKKSGEYVLVQPGCHQWDCPACAEENQKKWVYLVGYGASVWMDCGEEFDFVTLTSHERLTTQANCVKALRHGFNVLSSRFRRVYPRPVYVAICEHNLDEERLHLHMVISSFYSERNWKDIPRECGFGYMNDCQRVRSAAGVSHYVTKYLAKQLVGGKWPRGFRRVRTSHGWPIPPAKDENYDIMEWEYLGVFDVAMVGELAARKAVEWDANVSVAR